MPVPAFAGTGSGGHPALDPRVRGDERRLSQRFTCQTAKSCSQVLQPSLQYKQASSPVLFGEAPGRPVFPLSPLKDEGDGAPRGATIVLCVPAFPLGNTGRRSARHPDKLAHVRIYLRASSLRRRAALFVAARETRNGLRQPSSWRAAPIGRQAEPRRRPGACFARHARGRRIRPRPHDAS